MTTNDHKWPQMATWRLRYCYRINSGSPEINVRRYRTSSCSHNINVNMSLFDNGEWPQMTTNDHKWPHMTKNGHVAIAIVSYRYGEYYPLFMRGWFCLALYYCRINHLFLIYCLIALYMSINLILHKVILCWCGILDALGHHFLIYGIMSIYLY